VILETGKGLSGIIQKEKGGATFVDEMIPKMRHALIKTLESASLGCMSELILRH